MSRMFPGGPIWQDGGTGPGYVLAKAPLPDCPPWCEFDGPTTSEHPTFEHCAEIGIDAGERIVVLTQCDLADYTGGWDRQPPRIHICKAGVTKDLNLVGLKSTQAYALAGLMVDDDLPQLLLRAVELVNPKLCEEKAR